MNVGRTDCDGNFARRRIPHRVNRSPAQSDCLCACFWHIDVGVRIPSTEPASVPRTQYGDVKR